MKTFTEQQVDDLIKLKFGKLVTTPRHTSYASDRILGKIFDVSGSQIRRLYRARFDKISAKSQPLLERLQNMQFAEPRQRHGLRFLKQHEIQWLTSASTLKNQTSLSLVDRCKHFRREFPGANMNPTLLSQVYRLHGIKKKKYKWYKAAKEQDAEKQKTLLTTMKRLLTKFKNDGYRFVYLDETCFTRKTVADAEWSRPKENMTVDVKHLDEPTLALLCGVSKEKGVEHFQVF